MSDDEMRKSSVHGLAVFNGVVQDVAYTSTEFSKMVAESRRGTPVS